MSLPSTFDAGVVVALSALDTASIKHVFFIACGGSLSIMYPAKFLLDEHSPLPSDVCNAAEFVARAPRRRRRGLAVHRPSRCRQKTVLHQPLVRRCA